MKKNKKILGGNKMINYDKNDKVLKNIATIFEKRYKGKNDITLKIDDSLGEFYSKIEEVS